MTSHVAMKVFVGAKTDDAVQLTFHEDLPEETELWVPLKLIENPEVLEADELDEDGCCTVTVAKWFLKKNEVCYD